MNRLLSTIVLALALCATSCNEGRIYKEYQSIKGLDWAKDQVLTYKVPQVKAGTYALSLAFRYANGFPYKTVKFDIHCTAPSGAEQVIPYELTVINGSEYIGEAGLDIWDLDTVIDKAFKMEEDGDYTFTVQQLTNDVLQMTMEVGIYLDVTK